MIEPSSHASLNLHGRLPKAEKIRLILSPYIEDRERLSLLEIGTGSGAIAHYFAAVSPSQFNVCAVDVKDQRQVSDGYEFHVCDGTKLPFDNGVFDVVLTNHVIEHVGGRVQQSNHLREVARVLKNDGVAYLAAPSRWQFIEPHFRLAALSWLPRRWRDAYVRLARRGTHYDCDPLTHRELEVMLRASDLLYRNVNAAALKATLALEAGRHWWGDLLVRVPTVVLQGGYRLSPTMVYLAMKAHPQAKHGVPYP